MAECIKHFSLLSAKKVCKNPESEIDDIFNECYHDKSPLDGIE